MTSSIFTTSVLAAQKAAGSRVGALQLPSVVTPRLMDFVSARNSAYLATANATGLPTIQHRGGPAGFIRQVDDRTIGFADFRGNGHLISVGNLLENPKACLFLMDYENRWRVKIWGCASISEDVQLLERLFPNGYHGRARRLILLRVEAWDDNCSSHIPVKIEVASFEARIAALGRRITELEKENFEMFKQLKSVSGASPPAEGTSRMNRRSLDDRNNS